MGTFLDFTRLCVCTLDVLSLFFFFLSKWNTGQKYNISQSWRYCTCLDIWKKVNYFGYCYLFLFLHGPFIGIQFQMDRLFFLVLCSNVVWNPFLMKTTFTSDFSWFESVFVKIFENTSLLYQYSHLQETHRIMFSFLFFCCNMFNSDPTVRFQATYLVRWIFSLKVTAPECS